jgi:hypothetical protein
MAPPFKYHSSTVDLVHSLRKTGKSHKKIALELRKEYRVPTASRKYTVRQIQYMLYQREPHSLTSIKNPQKETPKKVHLKKGSFLHYLFYGWFK